MSRYRPASVTKAAAIAHISPDAPIILFMGGPGGGKTKHAAKIRDEFQERGLAHICVPDLIKDSISRYKDTYPEWKEAARRYERGELIPNNLAQDLVKAEMGRHPTARAYFLEGFPREARQVEDFEQNIRTVNMAMILDYDEDTLRKHMQNRGLSSEVIDRRINEFRQKTLPSAKYFDDHRLLHLIPGEKSDDIIFERMRKLVARAIETGVPVLSQTPEPSQPNSPGKDEFAMESSRDADESQAPSGRTGDDEGEEFVEENSQINGTSHAQRATSKTPTSSHRNAMSTEPDQEFRSSSPRENLVRSIAGAADSAKSRQTPINTGHQSRALTERNTSANGEIHSQPVTRDNQRQESDKQSNPATPHKPQTASSALSRPITNDAMQAQRATLPSSAAQQRILRADSQASAASKKSEIESRHSSVGQQTPTTQQPSSKPPTAGSRPATESNKQSAIGSRQASVVGTPKAVSQLDNRPPSSVASTPKPTSGFNDAPSQINSERMASSSTSRIPTAADRFPKGLPNNAPVILIIGAPGSNKAEIADKLAHKYDGFVHLSMGDLLRKMVQQNMGDELWSRVGKKMESGEQIPMKICRDLLYSTIHDMGSHSWGYVIEGYPRTLAQVEDLEAQLGRLDMAVLIDCTEAFCKENIRKRFEESRERGGNDRPDDNELSAKQRLGLFKQNTLPMLKHLDDKGKLRVVRKDEDKIEGDNGAEKLYLDVAKLLDTTLFIKDEQNRSNGDENKTENRPPTKNGT